VKPDDADRFVPEAERALAPLVGLPLRGSAREENALYLDFGTHTLQVLCAWRLTSGGEVVAGSGDLYTPADPDADVETFDWQEAGSTWWDVRMRAFHNERESAPPVVRAVRIDRCLGVRVELADGSALEVFPNSSAAAHVVTELWRLTPDERGAPTLVAHTDGLEVETPGGG
jgi:hypothetical protein